MNQINPTPRVHSQYGAPMGRPGFGHGAQPTTPFELRKIRLNQGGYDDGGAYWGTGAPLYWYCAYESGEKTVPGSTCKYCNAPSWDKWGECRWSSDSQHHFPTEPEEVEISDYIRADSREHAKEIILRKYPNVRFKR